MAVTNEEALWAVVDRIYEAVERPELWPATISAIGECIGGGPHFWGVDKGTVGWWSRGVEAHCRGTVFLSRADLKDLERYEQEFGELIVRFLKIIFLSVLWSQSEVGAREAIGLRMAQRYLEGVGSAAGTPPQSLSAPPRRSLLTALWENGHAFTSENLRAMRRLVPHLDRALHLQMRLSATELRVNLIRGALDALAIGVVLVDRSGTPVWINRRGQEIMRRSNVLRLSSRGFVGERPSDTQSLRELIKAVLSAGTQDVLAITRDRDELRPLLLIATPLNPIGASEAGDEPPCAVVFISDPDRTDAPSTESLRRAFNLTQREAQLAIAISQGHGLQAAADTMGVAVTTVKSQLQQAFAKTGTRHQAELAALVQRTLSHIRYN
jgi:DNA-binding CsgD family transcriptional regulator